MATVVRLCHLLCWFMCLSLGRREHELGVLAGRSAPEEDWLNNERRTEPGIGDAHQPPPAQQNPSLESQRFLKPVMTAYAGDGEESAGGRHEASMADSTESKTRIDEDSLKSHGILDSLRNVDPYNTKDAPNRLLGLLSKGNTDTQRETQQETEVRVKNSRDDEEHADDVYQTDSTYQGSHRHEADFGVLGGHSGERSPNNVMKEKEKQGEGPEIQAQKSQADFRVPDTQRVRTNGEDLGLLGKLAYSPVNNPNNKAETDHRTETQTLYNPVKNSYNDAGRKDKADLGVLGSLYIKPYSSSRADGYPLNQDGTAVPGEKDTSANYSLLALQKSNTFEENKYGDSRTQPSENIFNGSRYQNSTGSSNTSRHENVEPALKNETKAFAANEVLEKGGKAVTESLQQLPSKRPDLDKHEDISGNAHVDGGDDDDDEWAENQDNWYYNPDDRGGRKGKLQSSPKGTPSFSTATPWPVDSDEDSDEKGKHKGILQESPDNMYEKVILLTDVEKKKSLNGPKDSIILYTAIIVAFMAGIVIFSLWKKTSKKCFPSIDKSAVQTGEEGKRLLDHPFV